MCAPERKLPLQVDEIAIQEVAVRLRISRLVLLDITLGEVRLPDATAKH
jgi:hypothetical protein